MTGVKKRHRENIRRQLKERQGSRCALCGERMHFTGDPLSPFYATLDHIVPRKDGGSNNRRNLQLAHRKCNHERGHTPLPAAGAALESGGGS